MKTALIHCADSFCFYICAEWNKMEKIVLGWNIGCIYPEWKWKLAFFPSRKHKRVLWLFGNRANAQGTQSIFGWKQHRTNRAYTGTDFIVLSHFLISKECVLSWREMLVCRGFLLVCVNSSIHCLHIPLPWRFFHSSFIGSHCYEGSIVSFVRRLYINQVEPSRAKSDQTSSTESYVRQQNPTIQLRLASPMMIELNRDFVLLGNVDMIGIFQLNAPHSHFAIVPFKDDRLMCVAGKFESGSIVRNVQSQSW